MSARPAPRLRAAPGAGRVARAVLTACAALAACAVLAACAAPADHFYALSPLPDAARTGPPPSIQVLLQVTVPSLVDRNEMVLNSGRNGVVILDHERWAAPLSDQVSQTLARDLEGRRADLFVGDRRFDRAAAPPITLKVDIVRMSVRPGGRAAIEAHWRIADPASGVDDLGSGYFEAAVGGGGYAAVAQAYSETLADLAGRLAQELRTR